MSAQDEKQISINAAFFQEIKEDQIELTALIAKLEEVSVSNEELDSHEPEFRELLGTFRDQLAFHFALEEAYGYFEDAIEAAPHLHRQAVKLRNQHVELFEHAQRIADASTDREIKLATLAQEFRQLRDALDTHEASELKLISSAVQEDIGEGD